MRLRLQVDTLHVWCNAPYGMSLRHALHTSQVSAIAADSTLIPECVVYMHVHVHVHGRSRQPWRPGACPTDVRYRRDMRTGGIAVVTASFVALGATACGPGVVVAPPPALTSAPVTRPDAADDGPHKAAVAALIQPFLDAELLSAIVVGIYDHGAVEVYGFGAGSNGKPPDATTLFELGGVTKLYTALLLCDAVQRGDAMLDQAVSELLPAGVAVPTRSGKVITLRELANEASGLPALPASVTRGSADPYAGYTEDRLLAELPGLHLDVAPGVTIAPSSLGAALLGYALGRRSNDGFAAALYRRVLAPLDLESTFLAVPETAASRRIAGTSTDLASAPVWHWEALAPAGALVSDAHDQLALIRAELDAGNNGAGALRPAMRLAQDPQLESEGPNEGLGLQIDAKGRYWRNGSTPGFHSFVGFDPKAKRGVVLLAATALSPIDRVADMIYEVLDGKPPPPPQFPTAEQLAPYAGSYEIAGTRLEVTVEAKRIYVLGPGEPKHRLVPLTPNVFWLEELESLFVFESDEGNGGKITRLALVLPNHKRVTGPRV